MPHQLVVSCRREVRRAYDVYVGRPSEWGNPYVVNRESERELVVTKFCLWVATRPKYRDRVKQALKGKTLGCWCAPKLCHAEVLARLANGEPWFYENGKWKEPFNEGH